MALKIIALIGFLWLWLLTRFYTNEKKRQIPRWQLEDLALLKVIKTNAVMLWENHSPDRKIIRLKEWERNKLSNYY